jgi:hypothetical protein
LNNLHIWVFVKWELKELKLGVKESQVPGIWKKFRIKKPLPVLVISKKPQSQRITSSGYLKKIQNQRTTAGSGYFKKTSESKNHKFRVFEKNSESKNRCRFWLFQKNFIELPGFRETWKRGAR